MNPNAYIKQLIAENQDELATAAGGAGLVEMSTMINPETVQMVTQIAIAVATVAKMIHSIIKKEKESKKLKKDAD